MTFLFTALLGCAPTHLEPLEILGGEVELCTVHPALELYEDMRRFYGPFEVLGVDEVWPGGEPEAWPCSQDPAQTLRLHDGAEELWVGWTRRTAAGEEQTPAPAFAVGDSLDGGGWIQGTSRGLWLDRGDGPALVVGAPSTVDEWILQSSPVGEPGAWQGCAREPVKLGGSAPGEPFSPESGWSMIYEWALEEYQHPTWGNVVEPDCEVDNLGLVASYLAWSD